MTTPEEYEKSRKRNLWRVVHQLDVLHSEIASLYRAQSTDVKRFYVIWRTIDELEMQLKLEGIDYEHYTAERNARK